MITHLPDSGPHPIFRRLLLALVLLLAFPRFPHAADGDTFTYNGINYIVLSEADKTCATKPGGKKQIGWMSYQVVDFAGTEYKSEVLSLNEYVLNDGQSYKLTEISRKSFFGCSNITKLDIPKSVTSIGDSAFYNCSNLSTVSISGSKIQSKYRSFEGCNIETVTITGPTVEITLDRVFQSNFQPKQLIFANGIETIPSYVVCTKNMYNSRDLASITIPKSVTLIESEAFYYCSANELHIDDLAAWCRIKFGDSSSTPLSYYGSKVYLNGSEITDLAIPESIDSVNNYAFMYWKGLSSVNIPTSVKSIGNWAFADCTGLTSVSIPSSVTKIGSYVFQSCSGLASVNISEGVKTIGENAFSYCTGLTSLVIPESVTTIGGEAFCGDILKPLKISGRNVNLLRTDDRTPVFYCLDSESVIKCRGAMFEKIKTEIDYFSLFKGEVQIFDNPYEISNLWERYLGVEFELSDNPYYEPEVDVDVFAYVVDDGSDDNYTFKSEPMPIDSLGRYLIKGLETSGCDDDIGYYHTGNYILKISSIKDGENEEYSFLSRKFETKVPKVTFSGTVRQTSITIDEINVPSDISGAANKIWAYYNGKSYVYDGSPLTISGLKPNTEYDLFHVIYGNRYINYTPRFTTKDIALGSTADIGPTSAAITGTYDAGDAVVESTWWDDNSSAETKWIIVTGLKPNTSYTHTFHLVTDKGYSKSKEVTFTTPALELSVSDTKGVSATKTIVTATTNISDAETSVGFQWKKNDAPSTLKPREAYAVIYNGQLEGSLNNLQSTYYDVRAFYKDADGTYYYSDWLTFDPTDFSYFDPTVHTYPMSVEANETVVLNGYALAGTDDILSQGFQYWYVGPDNDSESTMNTLAADDPVITTVEAAGQKMSAAIGNLRPESVYAFRAFVKTASGYTYGEEQQFVTGDFNVSAIDEISADEADKEIVGYYNLTGLFSPRPYQGFNIVLYSDGSTRKMIIK